MVNLYIGSYIYVKKNMHKRLRAKGAGVLWVQTGPDSAGYYPLFKGESKTRGKALAFAVYSPILVSVPSPSCTVSFTDTEKVEHSVEVSALSLYAACVLGMAGCGFAEINFGPATTLTVSVKAPTTEHAVSVGNRSGLAIARAKSSRANRKGATAGTACG
jgi:hypothetical protein